MMRVLLGLMLFGAAQHAAALRHVYNESLPGIHIDQGDVVRLPNVSQQVSYYAVIRDVSMVAWVPRRHIPSGIHAAEREDVAARYARETWAITLRTLPSERRTVALRLVMGGWIGAGMLHQNGRIDSHNSFMPTTIPLKIQWQFEKAVPKDLTRFITSGNTIEINLPSAKVLDRKTVLAAFELDDNIPAQTSKKTIIINGHALKPLEVRFSGKPLQLPEYIIDPSDKQP